MPRGLCPLVFWRIRQGGGEDLAGYPELRGQLLLTRTFTPMILMARILTMWLPILNLQRNYAWDLGEPG